MSFTDEEALSVIKNIKKLSTDEILEILKQEHEYILPRNNNGNFSHTEKLMRISCAIRMIKNEIESLQKLSQKILFDAIEFEKRNTERSKQD